MLSSRIRTFNGTVVTLRLLLLLLLLSSHSRRIFARADDPENCQSVSDKNVVTLEAATTKSLKEIHIRHDLKGDVVLKDSPDEILEVELFKWGSKQDDIDGIWVTDTLFNAGRGSVLLLQVEAKERETSVLAIVAGVLGTVLFLVVICVLIWLYHRRHHSGRAPTSYTAGDSADGSLTRERTGSTRSHQSSQSTLVASGQSTQGLSQYGGYPPPPPLRATLPKEPQTTPKKYLAEGGTVSGGGGQSRGGVGSPRGMYKSTLLSFTLVTVVTLAYAGCRQDPHMRLVINIPGHLKINAVKLFVNKKYQNYIDASEWQQENTSSLHLYDLDHVGSTIKPPCSVQQVCPGAHVQGLVGCDPADGSCVCQRGYQLDSGVCIDYNECSTVANICPPGATCKNNIGSYECNCGLHFFHDHRQCKPCTRECGEGNYAALACTVSSDTVCKACSECSGSMYEARPCSSSQDTYCIHAAHPLLITEDDTTVSFLEGLKAESNSHVFIENLRSTMNFETNYYVTDTKQSIDFIWYRSSRVRINIGVSDVEMIPTYEDVTYDSDDEFMMDNPNTIDEKLMFKKVLQRQCRHPIPDEYSVTLEVARDRTTNAWEVTCNSKDKQTPQCPENYLDGDTYLHRTLNEECRPHGTYPEPLSPASNMIICTDEIHVLNGLFNLTAPPVRPIRFPARKCKSSSAECEQCLHGQKCNQKDVWQSKCCQIDCYASEACQQSASSHCSGPQIECAMGDAYIYTLQPVFKDIDNQYQCHLRHQKPQVLYKLWFYVSIPEEYGFETPRFHYVIHESDVENPNHGWHETEFLTVEHNSGLRAHDDVILLAHKTAPNWQYNYTIHSMKTPMDYGTSKPEVDLVMAGIYHASVQFDKPFSYSTSNWAKDGSGCRKDLGRFTSSQPHYKYDPQLVSVITQAVGEPYLYFLRSVTDPPYMRFSIPANISVLDWYFRDKGRVLVTNSSLQATLRLTSDSKIWTINISGMMSSCPAHMTITIMDRTEQEELFLYDVLVACPGVDFNLTFKVPNWGLQPDKTFEVLFKDSEKYYRIYLTHFLFEKEVEPMLLQSMEVENSLAAIGPFPVMLCFMLVLCLVSFLTYLILSLNRKVTKVVSSREMSRMQGCCVGLKARTAAQSTFIFLYIVWRIFFTFLFTFTILLSVLFMFMHPQVQELGHFEDIQERHLNTSAAYRAKMEAYAEREVQRHLEVIHNMQEACTHYLQELMGVVGQHMRNISAESLPRRSITHIMQRRLQAEMQDYLRAILVFTEGYNQKFEATTLPKLRRYTKYLKAVHTSDWFLIAQDLFNKTAAATGSSRSSPRGRKGRTSVGLEHGGQQLPQELAEFSQFVGIVDAEQVELIMKGFWQRYWRSMPNVAQLPMELLNTTGCDNEHSLQRQILPTNDATKERRLRDSMLYFADHSPEGAASAEEDSEQNISLAIAVVDLFHSADFQVVRFSLIILDILLVVYRLTHTALVVKSLCVGLEWKVELTAQQCSKTCQSLGLQASSSKPTSELLLPQQTTDPNVQLEYQIKPLTPHKANGNAGFSSAASELNQAPTSRPRWRSLLFTPIHSRLVPWIVIICVLCIVVYVVLMLGRILLSQRVVMEASTYLPSVSSLLYQYHSTNEFISSAASSYGQSLMPWCKNFTDQDLAQLHNLVQFFNREQSLLESRDRAEACSIDLHNSSSGNTYNCSGPTTPHQLHLPMLPCNFVPVQPLLYSGYQHSLFEQELWKDLSPLVSAFRRLLDALSYGVLSILACAVLLYSLGVTVFHALHSRGLFPTRVVYIVPASCADLAELPELGPTEDNVDGAEGPTCPDTEPSSGVSTLNPTSNSKFPLHVRFASKTKSGPNGRKGKPKVLLKDFHYSETKV